eukprot:GHVS01075249.1.p1 GENE.GHVS01075249.1~~GHVS01075249.1.p1  ORF type:complete len:700 (+),score=98.80 GHVS01075249.1:54-2153(+)
MATETSVRHPMTLSEKILCHNALGLREPFVVPGQVIVVRVARTLASELTLVGIKTCLDDIGNPQLSDPSTFFLACDHSVDPKNYHEDVIKKRIAMCQEFADNHNVSDYFGPNESILHTEFYRQKAEPGTVIVGADSHSCSHGCVGAYAMGMGAADVAMPLVTGTTWLKVPETVLIEFKGRLPFGMVGKDVMLYLLKLFGRNTVALDRCVEFGGELEDLDVDSRFALANMATEFGALAGIFPGDQITQGFLSRRKSDGGGKAIYFRADPKATYFKRLTVDLTQVQPFVALWPSPDNVFAVSDPKLFEPLYDADGTKVCDSIKNLDGVFIGACTTTENELILAGLLLEAAMESGGLQPTQRPDVPYKRKVTPGSRIMTDSLEQKGILKIYRKAGFEVGAAGCSYCLGVSADKAQPGEVWLSSQNRNFRNRMGRGAIGNVSSACVVAASSFSMTVTDPSPLLALVDTTRYQEFTKPIKAAITISEPTPESPSTDDANSSSSSGSSSTPRGCVRGRVQLFGDSVDTDAIIPAEFIPLRGQEQGRKAFHYARPEFVDKVVQGGATVVVAGEGFGCGSSREEAVSCLKFCGVEAVIAKSFSFIFGRNLLTLNLLGITIKDPEFYDLAGGGADVEIDVPSRFVRCLSKPAKQFPFEMQPLVEELYAQGGVVNMYKRYGHLLFRTLAEKAASSGITCGSSGCTAPDW